MEEKTTLTGRRVEEELGRFPPQVSDAFRESWKGMSGAVDDSQLAEWAEKGLALSQQTVRSWEAATQYFVASPRVIILMPFTYFVRWADSGATLCRDSPALAVAYFHASPKTLLRLRSRHIETWAQLGRSLYKGTWKSGTLATKFFEASPALLESLTVPQLERFAMFLNVVSRRSYDLAAECLALGLKVFPLLGEGKDAFLSLAGHLADTSWRQVKSLFESGARALPGIDSGQRLRFVKLIDRLRRSESTNVPGAMVEISQALSRLDGADHGQVLGLAERLLDVSPEAMPEFVKSCPPNLDRVTMGQLEKWFEEGLRVLEANSNGGLAYFRLESSRSQEVLEALSSSVEFTRVKDVMEMYCQALAGSEVELAASKELAQKHIGWVSEEAPSTEGSTVFVPSMVDRYPTKRDNFALYKVVSTHQVAHIEFGSFLFQYEKPSTLFEDLRPRLVPGVESSSGGAEGSSRPWITDMQRFFDLFEDRKLALDIFTVVEDGRLDTRVKFEYLGIKNGYEMVQGDSVATRPEIQSLPAREALVELLVRLSLRGDNGAQVPTRYAAEAARVARIARRVMSVEATVEDAAEATLRIWAILSTVPNEEVPHEDWQDIEADDNESDDDEDTDELVQRLTQGPGSEGSGEQDREQEYEPSQEVDYRGDFKPELVQLMAELRARGEDGDSEASGEPVTQEMLEELLKSSAEVDLENAQGELQNTSGRFADNMLKEAGLSAPQNPGMGQGPPVHVQEDGGSLETTDPEAFVYDEWDFRADDYKPHWCIVRQRDMPEGDPNYYGTTLQSYGFLVNQVRRQFELMVPEMFRKVRKLEDGEEIDIDDVIEARVDLLTGSQPSDKLYWRRNKVQRDVAVVFLLDTSASTAEAIEDTRKAADDWEAPDDPVEYMVWLRTRRGEGARRSYKRIIDLEKEAVVLLINALETIGDVYGIYGFSGYGRENVEFYIIKDIDEAMSQRVKNRIDRIAPLHATRMGPAIRHATTKLEAQDARTKLLILISDGRPQDRGYSREGVEKEYAVHDTKMALDEARGKAINAFCLTVDKNGHDYLKYMCEDIGYEVLDDIYTLPQRLLYLYRRLTM